MSVDQVLESGVDKGDEEHCPRLRDGEKVIAQPNNSICVPSVTNKMSVDQFLESILEEGEVIERELAGDKHLGQPGGVEKGDEDHCPRLRDGEKVIAESTNSSCVPSVTNKMSVDQVLESVLESREFQEYVDKKIMVRTDKLEETMEKFKKQTERRSDVTRECVVRIDEDVCALWDKVMRDGGEETDTDKVAGLTKVDGGNQSVSSNGEKVIAESTNYICVPSVNQSGQHLDTSSSKSKGKGVYLGEGNKNKNKVMKKTGGCISEE